MMRNLVLVALMLLLSAADALATNLPTLNNDATVDCTLTGTGTCALLTNGAGTVSFNLSSSGASGLTYNFQGTHAHEVSFEPPHRAQRRVSDVDGDAGRLEDVAGFDQIGPHIAVMRLHFGRLAA
ncbi:MAG TPA: hypothetical protein VGF39_14615, partial [Stellaceae bacterium]